jgi:hypothetical protein
MNTRWQKPVLIAFETPGDYTSIETTQAASWALIEDWPVEDGEALDKALLVCAAVDAGRKSLKTRARPSSPPRSKRGSTSRRNGPVTRRDGGARGANVKFMVRWIDTEESVRIYEKSPVHLSSLLPGDRPSRPPRRGFRRHRLTRRKSGVKNP